MYSHNETAFLQEYYTVMSHNYTDSIPTYPKTKTTLQTTRHIYWINKQQHHHTFDPIYHVYYMYSKLPIQFTNGFWVKSYLRLPTDRSVV